MKHLLLPALALLAASHSLRSAEPISLSKPIGDTLKPDLLYWAFDGGTPGSSTPNPVSDSSENGFDGYLLPGRTDRPPTYVAGKFGTAVQLRGESKTELDPHINWNAADTPGKDEMLLDLDGKSFTAGAWIKLTHHTPDQEETLVLFERGRSSGETSHWSLSITRRPDGRWNLMLHLPGAFKSVPITEVQLDDGEWHHIAVSLEANGDVTKAAYWLNGVALAEDVVIEALIPAAEPKDRLFTVGERNVSYHTSGVTVEVDEVFITSGIHQFQP